MEIEVTDDGRLRTGTLWTATAHAINGIVGTGVLTLPWSIAQLGWIMGPIVLVLFAFVTYYTSILLSDCYRSPDPISGRRNRTYMDATRAFLGRKDVIICGVAQYFLLWGNMVGYTITAAMSAMAIIQSNCFHKKGQSASCEVSGISYAVIFGIVEVVLSQFPSLETISLLSYVAASMSFVYSFIGLYLSAVALLSHHEARGSLLRVKMGSKNISPTTKIWHSFQALGNIAFAYTYSMVLIEIQDTLKSPPPEKKTMKRANVYSIGGTTLFYITLACTGYAAFGNDAPGNILMGFHEPFWLMDIANLALLVHLAGAYQIFAQPAFTFYEQWLTTRWPNADFIHRVYTLRFPFSKSKAFKFTLCNLLLRTLFVVLTTLVALMVPFFNAILGLLGSLGFFPLTVYYPVSMYIAQAKITKRQIKWFMLQVLVVICLLVSIMSTIGSTADIAQSLKDAKLFDVTL